MNLILRTCEAATTLTVFISFSKLYAACLSCSLRRCQQMYNWGRLRSSSSLSFTKWTFPFLILRVRDKVDLQNMLRQTSSRRGHPGTAFWNLAVGKLILARSRPSLFLICLKKRKGVQHLIVCLSSTLARKCLFASNWPWETTERLGLTEGLAGDV